MGGFPKGAAEKGESQEKCAAREAFEEVGLDVTHMIDKKEWFRRKIGSKVGPVVESPPVPASQTWLRACKNCIFYGSWSLWKIPKDQNYFKSSATFKEPVKNL